MSGNVSSVRSAHKSPAGSARERLLIFSRKGFDSSFGGRPSPRLPDGRLVSLPIPEPGSPITYGNCLVQPDLGFADLLGQLGTSHITLPHGGRQVRLPLGPGLGAHLDPDLRRATRPRPAGWLPLFGQADAAQQHLANQHVAPGDVLIFFGWFRDVEVEHGQFRYARRADVAGRLQPLAKDAVWPLRDYQAIWGWMEIGEILPATETAARHPWAAEHPHLITGVARHYRGANTVYISAPQFSLDSRVAGAGTLRYSNICRLTMQGARSRRWWTLPDSFHPQNTSRPLTYHPPSAWSDPAGGRVTLRSACIGQEFVVPINDGIQTWLTNLLTSAQPW